MYYIIYYYLLPTSSPLTLKNKNVRNLHICTFSGKEAAAHHRNAPQKKHIKEQKKCMKNLRMSLIFSNFVCR